MEDKTQIISLSPFYLKYVILQSTYLRIIVYHTCIHMQVKLMSNEYLSIYNFLHKYESWIILVS